MIAPLTTLAKALSPLLHASGYFAWSWRRWARAGGATVALCYHRVAPAEPGDARFNVERGTDPVTFEAQMRFMLHHFDPVLPSAAAQPAGAGRIRFCVTFDDGYADNFRVAAPILARLGIPAAFYVVTKYVGTERLYWWEQLAGMLRRTASLALDLEQALPGSGLSGTASLANAHQRERVHSRLCAALTDGPHAAVAPALARLGETLGVPVMEEGRDFPLMDWPQLRELQDRGFEIGCHSASHPNLQRATPEQLRLEVHGALTELQARLDQPVRSYVYPYGRIGPEAVAAVAEAGVAAAFSTCAGVILPGAAPFALPRIEFNRRQAFAWGYNVQRGFMNGAAALRDNAHAPPRV